MKLFPSLYLINNCHNIFSTIEIYVLIALEINYFYLFIEILKYIRKIVDLIFYFNMLKVSLLVVQFLFSLESGDA